MPGAVSRLSGLLPAPISKARQIDRHRFPAASPSPVVNSECFQSFGSRPLRLRSYTTSSTSLTRYLMPSLRLRRTSFFKFKIWKPACTSLMNCAIRSGRRWSPRVTLLRARRDCSSSQRRKDQGGVDPRRTSSSSSEMRARRYSSMVRWKVSRSLTLTGTVSYHQLRSRVAIARTTHLP